METQSITTVRIIIGSAIAFYAALGKIMLSHAVTEPTPELEIDHPVDLEVQTETDQPVDSKITQASTSSGERCYSDFLDPLNIGIDPKRPTGSAAVNPLESQRSAVTAEELSSWLIDALQTTTGSFALTEDSEVQMFAQSGGENPRVISTPTDLVQAIASAQSGECIFYEQPLIQINNNFPTLAKAALNLGPNLSFELSPPLARGLVSELGKLSCKNDILDLTKAPTSPIAQGLNKWHQELVQSVGSSYPIRMQPVNPLYEQKVAQVPPANRNQTLLIKASINNLYREPQDKIDLGNLVKQQAKIFQKNQKDTLRKAFEIQDQNLFNEICDDAYELYQYINIEMPTKIEGIQNIRQAARGLMSTTNKKANRLTLRNNNKTWMGAVGNENFIKSSTEKREEMKAENLEFDHATVADVRHGLLYYSNNFSRIGAMCYGIMLHSLLNKFRTKGSITGNRLPYLDRDKFGNTQIHCDLKVHFTDMFRKTLSDFKFVFLLSKLCGIKTGKQLLWQFSIIHEYQLEIDFVENPAWKEIDTLIQLPVYKSFIGMRRLENVVMLIETKIQNCINEPTQYDLKATLNYLEWVFSEHLNHRAAVISYIEHAGFTPQDLNAAKIILDAPVQSIEQLLARTKTIFVEDSSLQQGITKAIEKTLDSCSQTLTDRDSSTVFGLPATKILCVENTDLATPQFRDQALQNLDNNSKRLNLDFNEASDKTYQKVWDKLLKHSVSV